jgi:protein gp37
MGRAKYQRDGDPRASGPRLGVHEDALAEPLRWRTPSKVIVNSMSDHRHARVPAWLVVRVFAVTPLSPQHSCSQRRTVFS